MCCDARRAVYVRGVRCVRGVPYGVRSAVCGVCVVCPMMPCVCAWRDLWCAVCGVCVVVIYVCVRGGLYSVHLSADRVGR